MSPSPRIEASVTICFAVYVILSFFRVSSYAAVQIRERRLIDGSAAPRRMAISGTAGWAFVAAVLLFLFLQSPLYMILVVAGLSFFLWESRCSAQDQFGLNRVPWQRLITWSWLICGALIFVEEPLSWLVDRGMTVLHFPHPEQESVEFFRKASKPGIIVAFLIQAVLVSPLLEELFFRGFLFTFLKNYTSTMGAVILSGGVFAFAHANLGAALPLWVLGVVLALAYEHAGSLLLPLGIHACWNFLTAMSLLLDKGSL